jgi:hypothetical protein
MEEGVNGGGGEWRRVYLSATLTKCSRGPVREYLIGPVLLREKTCAVRVKLEALLKCD